MKKIETSSPAARPARDLQLPQIEPARLYRQIAKLIGDRIDEGVFPVGSLLPAERDLAQQLGVSRTSVREALIALEVSGRVSIRVGHGVQILQATPVAVRNRARVNDADLGPIQLMEARRHVELKTVELAAINRDRAGIARMEDALRLQASGDSVHDPAFREGDRTFHVEIGKAGGNSAFALIVGELWDFRYKPMFEKFEELLLGPERLQKTEAEHRRILAAIVDRDPAAARKAMRAHLDAVLKGFLRGIGKSDV